MLKKIISISEKFVRVNISSPTALADSKMMFATSGGGQSRPQYKTALSVESGLLSSTGNDIVDVEAEGNRFRRRRRATIIAIAAIFVTAGTVLIVSVVHDLQNRPEFGYFDEICSESDMVCLENKCPEGFQWDRNSYQCKLNKGKTNKF